MAEQPDQKDPHDLSIAELVAKAEWLDTQVAASIEDVGAKRKLNQRRATCVKLSTLILSALATILLGLSIAGLEDAFKNIAFVATAIVTLLSALEPYFNFRALWVEHELAKAKLHRLRDELAFFRVGRVLTDADREALDDFQRRYQIIWVELSEAWIRERRRDVQQRPELAHGKKERTSRNSTLLGGAEE